jgi:hypothetical protein
MEAGPSNSIPPYEIYRMSKKRTSKRRKRQSTNRPTQQKSIVSTDVVNAFPAGGDVYAIYEKG